MIRRQEWRPHHSPFTTRMNHRPILLASASPRRRDLLQEHGYTVRIKPADVDELMPDYLTVGETTLFNARLKARAVACSEPDSLVIAADTLVAIDGRILGKPRDLEEAFEMLSLLNGKTHQVFSGVWIASTGTGKMCGFVEVSHVTFRMMTEAEIHEYMRRIGPLDKAGAYAAQQNEMELIALIEGSRTNVIGLPMEKLAAELDRFKTWSTKHTKLHEI